MQNSQEFVKQFCQGILLQSTSSWPSQLGLFVFFFSGAPCSFVQTCVVFFSVHQCYLSCSSKVDVGLLFHCHSLVSAARLKSMELKPRDRDEVRNNLAAARQSENVHWYLKLLLSLGLWWGWRLLQQNWRWLLQKNCTACYCHCPCELKTQACHWLALLPLARSKCLSLTKGHCVLSAYVIGVAALIGSSCNHPHCWPQLWAACMTYPLSCRERESRHWGYPWLTQERWEPQYQQSRHWWIYGFRLCRTGSRLVLTSSWIGPSVRENLKHFERLGSCFRCVTFWKERSKAPLGQLSSWGHLGLTEGSHSVNQRLFQRHLDSVSLLKGDLEGTVAPLAATNLEGLATHCDGLWWLHTVSLGAQMSRFLLVKYSRLCHACFFTDACQGFFTWHNAIGSWIVPSNRVWKHSPSFFRQQWLDVV